MGELGSWILGPGGSLWAIRGAMALLAIGYALQFRTGVRNSRRIAMLWCIGAALATYHTWTALDAFHGGSLAEAVESTARRTEALFGVRVGGGVYVNYVFIAVWWVDAIWRWQAPQTKLRPMEVAIDLFLILMSFFGAVVFASGPIRSIGIGVIAAWIWMYGKRRAKSKERREKSIEQ